MEAGPPAAGLHSFDLKPIEDDPLGTSSLDTDISDVGQVEVDCLAAKPPADYILLGVVILVVGLPFAIHQATKLVETICIPSHP